MKKKQKVIINSINTNSAGTSNITKMIINEGDFLSENVSIIIEDNICFKGVGRVFSVKKVHFGQGLIRIAKRAKFDFFDFYRDVKAKKYDVVAIMANYSIFPVGIARKIVLMRHPYLVDKDSWLEIETKKQYFVELIRKFMFNLTLKSTDKLVLQTEAMYKLFKASYPNFTKEIQILNNPISESILKQRGNSILPLADRSQYLFYPSRYYDHKNHKFLLDLAIQCKNKLLQKKIKIVVTLDENGDGREFLSEISKLKLDDVFLNIGEVNQEDLHYYYMNSLMLFFPSKAETFGNSIAEAMCFGLPIFISNKPYARSLCKKGAFYSDFGKPDDVMKELDSFLKSWDCYSKESRLGSLEMLNSKEWFNSFIK
jgi:glycosyltransferase involved in cell wall biosynthesis